jgi:hypothetical protein
LGEVAAEEIARLEEVFSADTPPLEAVRRYLLLKRDAFRGCRLGRLVHEAGATLPVSRNRRTQLIAELTPTPKCAAARDRTCRHVQPPQPPAREDQQNMVCPSMLASVPASMLNQSRPDLGTPNRLRLNSSRSSWIGS